MRFVVLLVVFIMLGAAVLLLRGTVLFVSRWWVFILAALCIAFTGLWARSHSRQAT